MKKILIVCLTSILIILNLTGCKSENTSNHNDKRDMIGADLEKESKTQNKEDEADILLTKESSYEDMNEIIFRAMLDLMNKRLDKITYSAPKSVIVDVVADNNHVYSITDQGYKKINDALISTDGLD